MNGQMPVSKDDPMMLAWEAYKQTEDFRNAVQWALRVIPFIQADDPDANRKLRDLMPLAQREDNVVGALWNAFSAGYKQTPAEPKHEESGG